MRAAAALLLLAACGHASAADDPEFADPKPVAIIGDSDDAMEPFLTRDGTILIFNNSNDPSAQTDLHWAERVDDLTFVYRGKIDGVNSSALDGVGTVDSAGNMYFVTTRSYALDLMTIYDGRFNRGVVTGVAPVKGVSLGVPFQVNFDAEISADGTTLYFVDGLFALGGQVPLTADLAVAVRGTDGEFHRLNSSVLAAVNTSALEYAACISEDQRELFFTRLEGTRTGIYRSTRPDISSDWGTPRLLSAITGFVEAPTIAPGGNALYYHARRNGRFVIERVTRQPAQAPTRKRRAVGRG